jgi:hypothetical protein
MLLVAAVVAATLAPGHPVRQGAGQQPGCLMNVVHCNYAHFYSGTYSWQSVISDADTRNETNLTVTVQLGNAHCTGFQSELDLKTGSSKDTISGPGLFAVEFGPDSANKLSYTITAACPSPAYQGRPPRPAELGKSFSQESYTQPATSVGMTPLVGSWSIPAPETDSINGVIGTLKVSWSLKR